MKPPKLKPWAGRKAPNQRTNRNIRRMELQHAYWVREIERDLATASDGSEREEP